jgi:WD40 repeat protein
MQIHNQLYICVILSIVRLVYNILPMRTVIYERNYINNENKKSHNTLTNESNNKLNDNTNNSIDNPIIKQQINISNYLNNFFPSDISKIIKEYNAYYIEGIHYYCMICPKLHSGSYGDRGKIITILSDGRIIRKTNAHSLDVWNPFKWRSEIEIINNTSLNKSNRLLRSEIDIIDNTLLNKSDCIIRIVELLNNRIICVSNKGSIKIRNLHSGKTDIKFYNPNPHLITCVAAFPNGNKIVSSAANELRIWNLQNKKCDMIIVDRETDYISCFAISSDGWIVSESKRNELKIWNIKTGKCIKSIECHEPIKYIAVLPDNRLIVVSNIGIKIINPETGKCIAGLAEVNLMENGIATLPDGQIIIGVYSLDESLRNGFYVTEIKIWDPLMGKCIVVAKFYNCIKYISVLLDGRILVIESDNTVIELK